LKKNIAFITVASGVIGMGHLIRSLSLAEMLRNDFNISFIISTDTDDVLRLIENSNFRFQKLASSCQVTDFKEVCPFLKGIDIVVLDFYPLTKEFQKAIKDMNLRLVCIDDFHNGYFHADLIINTSNKVTAMEYDCEPSARLLLGSEYILLRPEFIDAAKKRPRIFSNISSVFINMGGSDMPNNTLKFLKAAITIKSINEIHVVLGLINPHIKIIAEIIKNVKPSIRIYLYQNLDAEQMCSVLSKCQLAICPASGVSMEVCAVGLGMFSGYSADNQISLLKGLVDKDCAINLGAFELLSENKIASVINSVINDMPKINHLVKSQKKAVDGKSPARIRKEFELL